MMVIRCDASVSWGLGHLMRCRALAQAFKKQGMPVSLVGPSKDFTQAGDEDLFAHWHPMPWNVDALSDANQLLTLAEAWHATALVLDDPRVDEAYQLRIRDAGRPWLQFDGTATKPLWASWVLNALPSANEHAYSKVVCNADTQLLLGPKYALLRPEFTTALRATPTKEPLNIFISFGGGDDRGAMAWCLEALLPLLGPHLHLKIMSGASNPRNAFNQRLLDQVNSDWFEYHVQPSAPWNVLAQCHLAILASGTTAHEVNYFQIPMILVSIVDNQHAPGKSWEAANQAKYMGLWSDVSVQALHSIAINSVRSIQEGTLKIHPLVDGQGASRVALALLAH